MDKQNRFAHISKDAYNAINFKILNNKTLDNNDIDDKSPHPEDEYVVNKIIGDYVTKNTNGFYERMYVVEWRNNERTITEEPADNLTHCDDIINKYINAKYDGKIKHKGIIYNRVSTRAQFKKNNCPADGENNYSQGQSMQTQFDECIKFCEASGVFPYKIVQEVGSAYRDSRPKFREMIDTLNKNEIIIVHEPDRFLRNMEGFENLLYILTIKNCDVVDVRDNIDFIGHKEEFINKIKEAEMASTEKSKKMIERHRIRRDEVHMGRKKTIKKVSNKTIVKTKPGKKKAPIHRDIEPDHHQEDNSGDDSDDDHVISKLNNYHFDDDN